MKLGQHSHAKERFAVDIIKFLQDFDVACAQLSLTPVAGAAEIGVARDQIYQMRTQGRVPGTLVFLALCSFTGLNPLDYLLDLQDARYATPKLKRTWTYSRALERIKQLEEELKRASQQTRDA